MSLRFEVALDGQSKEHHVRRNELNAEVYQFTLSKDHRHHDKHCFWSSPRSSSKRSSADMFGSKSTRFLTTPNAPESGRTSPTASRIEGAFVVNHAPTFVSRSWRLFFEGVNGAKVYSAQHEDVDAVKVVPCRGSSPHGNRTPQTSEKRPAIRPAVLCTSTGTQQGQGFQGRCIGPLRAAKRQDPHLQRCGFFHAQTYRKPP